MDLYQAGYYRQGKQGANSGWKLVSPSEGMSQIAKEGFKGIASNLAGLKGAMDMPETTLGVFQYDRFVYLMHVNYVATGEDSRGVSYVHGYCFNMSDYYALCIQPEMLFGMADRFFLSEYDASVESYPVIHDWEYQQLNITDILQKYGITDEKYREILIGVTCALEGYSGPMCIKCACTMDAYKNVYREIMYAIMCGLPYHLRIKLSFSSFRGGKTKIYFSDRVEEENYFDLDTKECFCDRKQLENYHFTKIYMLPADDPTRNIIYKNIAEFMEASFDKTLYEIGCEQVEAGFQAKIKKNIEPNDVNRLLNELFKHQLTENVEVDAYLASILLCINEHHVMTENNIYKKLEARYKDSNCEEYIAQFSCLESRWLCQMDREEAFSKLWNYYRNSRNKYEMISGELQKFDPGFWRLFYIEGFLPRYLVELDDIPQFVAELDSYDDEELFKKILKIFYNITEREMRRGLSFKELFGVHNNCNRVWEQLPMPFEAYRAKHNDFMLFTLWNNFNINQFSTHDIDRYNICKVSKFAEQGFNGRECINAQIVESMITLVNMPCDLQTCNLAYRFFFTNEILSDKVLKKNIQSIMRKKFMDEFQAEYPGIFDMSLMLSYNLDEDCFMTYWWVKMLFTLGVTNLFSERTIEEMVSNSILLNENFTRDVIVQSLYFDLHNRKWERRLRSQKRALNRYYDFLCGKKVWSEEEIEEQQLFWFTLHRITLFCMIIGVEVMCVVILNKYWDISKFYCSIALSISLLIYLVIMILKIVIGGGVAKYMEDAGLTTWMRIIVSAFLYIPLILVSVFLVLYKIYLLIPSIILFYFICSIILEIVYLRKERM